MFSILCTLLLAFQPIPCDGEKVLQLVAPILGDKPIVVEAGAYDGQDTMMLARRWPRGLILTFEPHPILYNQCKNKLALFKNIRLARKGLSEKSGVMTFYLSDVNGQPYASSSLHPPHIHKEAFPWVTFTKSIDVPVISLDEALKKERVSHIDFFWLDVQGHELPLLKGYSGLDKTKALWCEVSFIELYQGQALFDELRDFLEEHDFIVVGADFYCELKDDKVIAPNPPSCGNAFFVKRELVPLLNL